MTEVNGPSVLHFCSQGFPAIFHACSVGSGHQFRSDADKITMRYI